MTANVSFYLIEILALRVKSHSLQERNVSGNVLIVDHHVQIYIYIFSIYTLIYLGELSNLIGLLSRTIQQYSPPSEWIMCELGVFPIFSENDVLKVDKILGLTFLRQEKTWKDSIRRFSIYCS